jgi:uncharacterized protein YfaS (alpha-2-macroglobulin family)
MLLKKLVLVMIPLFITTLAFTQPMKKINYTQRFNKVDSLINKKGLLQTALKEVNLIYALARQEKQETQLIKALLYKLALQNNTQPESLSLTIAQLEKELPSFKAPAKNIVNSLLADLYLAYFNQHRYQLYSRTETTGYIKKDISTWSRGDFHTRISTLFAASLKETTLLQQTPVATIEPLLIKGNVRYLRPTLFDLLAHRALDYYKSGEITIDLPQNRFEINSTMAFDPAADFVTRRFTTTDTASLQHKALLLYQQLIRFHLLDKKPDALIDVDLQRYEFVRSHATTENKEDAYELNIKHIAHQYNQTPAAAQAWYLLARLHADKAASYEPFKTDTTNSNPQFEYVKALEICNQVLLQKQNSEGKTNCENLRNEILARSVSLESEKVNTPGLPFRTLVTYKNIPTLHLRLIKVNNEVLNKLADGISDEYWKYITSLQPINSWQQPLPATNDYQTHSTEIKMDALPVGAYILLTSAAENFSTTKNPLAQQYLYVSAISYVNKNDDYFVLHRETGQPIANASIQVWNSTYNYDTRKYIKEKAAKASTDKNGYVKLQATTGNERRSELEIKTTDDYLYLNNEVYLSLARQENSSISQELYEKNNSRSYFFTDRSIYRPGQMVYFKAISITRDFNTRQPKLLTNKSTIVSLYDVNGQKLDSLKLTTNEFGSYAGQFQLPSGVLTGQFRLEDESIESNSHYFSVEEYKRPKFYTNIETPVGSYRLNDSITVKLHAMAYAGNAINNAAVKYRVERGVRFPYPWLSRWSPQYDNTQQMAAGETTTDASGNASIVFKAMPNKKEAAAFNPVYTFTVYADVTDLNGETRSAETSITVSSKALQVQLGITDNEKIEAASFKSVMVSTTNSNAIFEPAKLTLRIYPLQAPAQLLRPRYWQQADQYVLTEASYRQLFPYDIYKNEDEPQHWPLGKAIITHTDSTKNAQPFAWPATVLKPGWYQLEATAVDKYGDTIKDIRYIELYDKQQPQLAYPAYDWQVQNKTTAEPGDTVTLSVGSSATDIFLVQQYNYGNGKEQPLVFKQLNKEIQTTTIAVQQENRGGFEVSGFFVKHNRVFTHNYEVAIPFTNKDLQINLGTYRNKTLPGSKETWKLKISGYKKDKIAAELVAGMYDASLDQFRQHNWSKPPIWHKYLRSVEWSAENNFAKTNSTDLELYTAEKEFEKRYDEIIGQGTQPLWWLNPLEYQYSFREGISNVKISSRNKGFVRQEEGYVNGFMMVKSDAEYSKFTAPKIVKDEEVVADGIPDAFDPPKPSTSIQPRKNFNETAFFFPQLATDSAGNIELSFTMPEALTQWKLQTLAHTKDLSVGMQTASIITQKELMVQPNVPRFLREGDQLSLSTKVANITNKELTGTVQLELLDAATLKPVDGWFRNMFPTQYFTAAANESTVVNFTIDVPYQYNSALVYRFIAKTDSLSDGEEAALPVLTNTLLVTESMPLPLQGNAPKHFKFNKLAQSSNSETLQQHRLTVEFTSNPAWYAVQALPYLTSYPYECAEQTFNRYYANALAAHIAASIPNLPKVVEAWKKAGTLKSPLQQNEELKAVLLQETPWVLEGASETQQQQQIALLFDMLRMNSEQGTAFEKLKQQQSSNGGFVWFNGGPDDRYITQYILSGMGHLKQLNVLTKAQWQQWQPVIKKALAYTDARLVEDYNKQHAANKKSKTSGIAPLPVQYLYMRSFFADMGIDGKTLPAVTYYRKQAQQNWVAQSKYLQGMIALALYRSGDKQTAAGIIKSLEQTATNSPELGMYWKENSGGYYWQQAPIETQSLLIEAFATIKNNDAITNALKTWLLQQKQTNSWQTTRATAEACYALLLQGSNWLSNTPAVTIQLGDKTINSNTENALPGSGYIKKTFVPPFVTPAMADITVKMSSNSNNAPAWGAVYWQYFERLENITPAATPLQLSKKIMVQKNNGSGIVLQPINAGDYIKVGDKITVRIEIRADRDMEYIHLKDMRASCLEPVTVLSGYQWQGRLGYYQSTKDASTNFFIGYLPRGTHVFEYSLYVTHAGNYSNGVTTIQSMYAPAFAAHSEGIRINAEE